MPKTLIDLELCGCKLEALLLYLIWNIESNMLFGNRHFNYLNLFISILLTESSQQGCLSLPCMEKRIPVSLKEYQKIENERVPFEEGEKISLEIYTVKSIDYAYGVIRYGGYVHPVFGHDGLKKDLRLVKQ